MLDMTQTRGRGDQQAETENRAAMGVDATRRPQHCGFRLDAEHAQMIERRAVRTGGGDRHEVATQREQAAQEGGRVHVIVAAAAPWCDQPGFGGAGQFGMQAGDRHPGQPMRSRRGGGRWQRGGAGHGAA